MYRNKLVQIPSETIMINRRQKGNKAEEQAHAVLVAKGYCLLHRNYACPWGEIDLVMRDQECLVFVEVRARQSTQFGSPMESIRKTKQKRLLLTVKDYLLHHPYDGPFRFDIVSIMNHSAKQEVIHLENALESSLSF